MKTVRISARDAQRIANLIGPLQEGENLLGTGAKLYKVRRDNRSFRYLVSGYHWSGADVDAVLADFGINAIG